MFKVGDYVEWTSSQQGYWGGKGRVVHLPGDPNMESYEGRAFIECDLDGRHDRMRHNGSGSLRYPHPNRRGYFVPIGFLRLIRPLTPFELSIQEYIAEAKAELGL